MWIDIHRNCACAAAMFLSVLISNPTWAGELKEARQRADATGQALEQPDATIFHRVWPSESFPLKWHLQVDGVVNNTRSEPVSKEDALNALKAGFRPWADLETARISIEYAGETEKHKAACDLVNIVSWKDEESFQGGRSENIARGITSFYAGPDITLDDSKRMNVPCSAGESRPGVTERVDLPTDKYPNGMLLKTGTILDMDLVWNSQTFDFVTTFSRGSRAHVFDIQALATHEFGHMLGLTHTSMHTTTDLDGADTPTMTVKPVDNLTRPSREFQESMRILAPDDIAAAGSAYPGAGFFPGGTEPFTTGAISGNVTTQRGGAVEGARLWLYSADPNDLKRRPLYETFTATSDDNDLRAGDYVFKGIPVGEYFLCIQPWKNLYPDRAIAESSEGNYNWSVAEQPGKDKRNTNFKTECYNDVSMIGPGKPSLRSSLRENMRRVSVDAGETTMLDDISVAPHP